MATPTSLPATFVAGNVLTAAQMNDLRGAFRILQVVSTTKTDTFSASVASGAYADVTGLSVSITPTAATSKILIIAHVSGGSSITYERLSFQLVRDSTAIGIGDAASNRTRVTSASLGYVADTNGQTTVGGHFLDSPATTSATTYKVQVANAVIRSTSQTLYVNRSHQWQDVNYIPAAASSLTVMEVSA